MPYMHIDINFLIGEDINGKFDVFDMDHNKLGGAFAARAEADAFVQTLVDAKIDELSQIGVVSDITTEHRDDVLIYRDREHPISLNEGVELANDMLNQNTKH